MILIDFFKTNKNCDKKLSNLLIFVRQNLQTLFLKIKSFVIFFFNLKYKLITFHKSAVIKNVFKHLDFNHSQNL